MLRRSAMRRPPPPTSQHGVGQPQRQVHGQVCEPCGGQIAALRPHPGAGPSRRSCHALISRPARRGNSLPGQHRGQQPARQPSPQVRSWSSAPPSTSQRATRPASLGDGVDPLAARALLDDLHVPSADSRASSGVELVVCGLQIWRSGFSNSLAKAVARCWAEVEQPQTAAICPNDIRSSAPVLQVAAPAREQGALLLPAATARRAMPYSASHSVAPATGSWSAWRTVEKRCEM